MTIPDDPSATSEPAPAATPRSASPAARARLLAPAPRVLLALAGACTLSGVGGFAWIVLGQGAPPAVALLAPPALVLVAAPFYVLRGARSETS